MNKQRLLKLADYLRGDLPFTFDFSTYSSCALYACIHLFPDDWELNEHTPNLKGYNRNTKSTIDYFGLSNEDEKYHLFHENLQNIEKYGGKELSSK